MLKLAQTDRPTDQQTNRPTDRAKTISEWLRRWTRNLLGSSRADIIGINLVTKFHENWTINVASRPYKEKCPAPGGHHFKATKTMFKLIQDIIGTNLLTKFHDDRKFNVNSRPFFQPTSIIFELVQDIIGTNFLTKSRYDQAINVASRVLTRFYFSHTMKNARPLAAKFFKKSKFHEDLAINVASRVLTRKNAPPPGGNFFNQPASFSNSHVFQANVTIYELIQDIIETNLLTKFHKLALTSKNARAPGGNVFQPTRTIFKLVH
ncbi:hypothetical protein DPMN_132566 [Dreissena polymorpha]|uniref:Uncharacterized protein n=1 Tax=Dreissena polymorpha TaxID=45954 RepID=A0A9D4FTM3_DREPO|nr:hypothetical protein DPMN_132566 [Dreissena polymorpha]